MQRKARSNAQINPDKRIRSGTSNTVMKRGIFLVANLKSQSLCANLIHSIRNTGCSLPIRLIHFGGDRIDSEYILNECEILDVADFPAEALDLIESLQSVLTVCPKGFLYRFLAWFSDWDEFIYSDNDVVALCNWENLFEYLPGYHIVHADEEYTTGGKFNYHKPEKVKESFGDTALDSALTAGHFLAKRDYKMLTDLKSAIEWFHLNPDVPIKHDQALIHIASLIGKWKMLNLCRGPHNWLSTWAGDYKNSMDLIHSIQFSNSFKAISHLHYSGNTPQGNLPIEEFLFANLSNEKRLSKIIAVAIQKLSGAMFLNSKKKRAFSKLRGVFNR